MKGDIVRSRPTKAIWRNSVSKNKRWTVWNLLVLRSPALLSPSTPHRATFGYKEENNHWPMAVIFFPLLPPAPLSQIKSSHQFDNWSRDEGVLKKQGSGLPHNAYQNPFQRHQYFPETSKHKHSFVQRMRVPWPNQSTVRNSPFLWKSQWHKIQFLLSYEPYLCWILLVLFCFC